MRVLRSVTQIAQKGLAYWGVSLLRNKRLDEIRAQRRALFDLLKESWTCRKSVAMSLAEGVVFSKDRPMQLHALLSSYFEKASNPMPLHVLYKPTSSRFQAAYAEVVAHFKDRGVNFIQEKSFRDDLGMLLESIKSDKIFFLVDDVIFADNVDMVDFASIDVEHFIPSLRLGKNLTQCYTVGCGQPLPEFLEGIIVGNDRLCWRWRDGKFDWGYPMSVDGHLFSTLEVTLIVKVSQFAAPNSFELALHGFSDCFMDRYGLCYVRSKIMNIPWNKVQTENSNDCGNVHQQHLLDKWEQGFQVDYRKLYSFVNESAHQEILLPLVRRE